MLTQNLKKLELDGIVVQKDLSDLVLHIEYDFDEAARESVCALLDHLVRWGTSILAGREVTVSSLCSPHELFPAMFRASDDDGLRHWQELWAEVGFSRTRAQ
jgi:hypothetical protein